MRMRLALGIIAVVILLPQAAAAKCLVQRFDEVVRSSDAVLLGTIANATATKDGIILRLDVEQPLKGLPANGQQVRYSSCAPAYPGDRQSAQARADQMIGTRDLFLITENADGTFSQYGDVITPQRMSLNEKIARARDLSGVGDAVPLAPFVSGGINVARVVLIVVAIGVLIAGAVLLTLSARRS
jgi:hypothetical protein